MKGITKKIILAALAIFTLCNMTTYAFENSLIMETYTGGECISVYVKGVSGDPTDVSVQIGTSTGEVVAVEPVTEREVSMQTLIMLDNSLSIRKKDRVKIENFLQNLISDRDAGEEMAIAVFGEDMTWLAEYTGDYSVLKQAVDGIIYQNQETYLTNVLYELLAREYPTDGEDVYRRIIVVSDGVDNKSIGYTKEELYDILKETPYPIYTIGCVNGKNEEELENMFALSRMTAAQAFLMDDVENTLDITDTLKADRDIVRLEIIPEPEAMDGSRKAVKISYTDQGKTGSLSANITMPQQTKDSELNPESQLKSESQLQSEPQSKPQSAAKSVSESKPEVVTDKLTYIMNKLKGVTVWHLVAAGGGLAAIVIAIFAVVWKRGKGSKDKQRGIGFGEILGSGFQDDDDGGTEILGDGSMGNPEDTVFMWNDKKIYQAVLVDVNSPMRTFQAPLQQSITIAGKRGMGDIVLDYEKSRTVSKEHCQISVRNGKFYVKDLHSSNGTYVNGNRVTAETEIFPGDVLKLGRLEMRFDVR